VPLIPPNLYEEWRNRRLRAAYLKEGGDGGRPPEKLLQQIWKQQRILRNELTTIDGQSLKVLHPGFWNQEAGPDFRKALIQVGGGRSITGDVEIDLSPQGWKQHGHATNPNYKNVILHVVWDPVTIPVSSLPTLSLASKLDSTLEELTLALGVDTADLLPEGFAGQCSAPLKLLQTEVLEALLRQAAEVRLKLKAGLLHSQARQNGWEQALWEGLFAALGYKNNSWPMRRMAELLPCLAPSGRQPKMDAFAWQARLLGVGNLLPAELTRAQAATDSYLKRLWDHWWRERDRFGEFVVPREAWKFSGLRPPNHPQRRIALASHWLAAKDLPQRLESWATKETSKGEVVDSLAQALPEMDDDFWSEHWTFKSAGLKSKQPLLGQQRLTDLAINVVLPWLWVRAVTGRNSRIRQTIEQRYFSWPAAEDNSVLKLARQRLIAGAAKETFRTAAAQQGLIQITRDFCDHSNAVCDHCPFPELVRSIR
jgi:hypothetical protein